MDSQFTLTLGQKPYEDPFGAFLRPFANGLQNNAPGNRRKKDICVLDAGFYEDPDTTNGTRSKEGR